MLLGRLTNLIFSLLLAVVFASALMPAGCAPRLPPEPEWEQQASLLLDQAEGLFAKRQYDQAAKAAEAFFALYPKSRRTDRAFGLMGEIRLAQRNYGQALSYYKEIIEKYPASSLTVEAKYKLGLCYFELKEYDLAAANLEDRSKITEPEQLKRIAQMLSVSYVFKKNYPAALKEYVSLVQTASNDQQRAGYRDRVRELIDKNLNDSELKALSAGVAYPADLALLRLAALQIEQRSYRDAIKTGKDFLVRFPNHPEKIRGELLLNDATSKLTAPRFMLGALLPLTGQVAFFGERVLRGIQLAIHDYNLQMPDSRVELLIKDTEGSPDKAVAELGELASKDIVAAVGPITTREEEALMPALEKYHVPMIRPAASRSGFPVKSGWMFRNALTIDSQAKAAAQFALGQKLKKFVIFYPDEPYGKDLARLFGSELEHKAEVLATISYPSETKDFGPYVRKLIEIDLRSRKIPIPEDDAERKKLFAEYTPSFDCIYLPGYAERIGLLIPQLAFYNVSGIAMLGSDNWHTPDLIERAGRYTNGAVFVDGFFPESADPAIRSFVEAYRSAYQEEPDILAAQAYDAATMALSLLKNGKDSPIAVRDGLLALKDYPGISGAATFAGSYEAQKQLFLIKIEDGKFTRLIPEK
jgi:branched-chain amino acid transport system substrate-binding protein